MMLYRVRCVNCGWQSEPVDTNEFIDSTAPVTEAQARAEALGESHRVEAGSGHVIEIVAEKDLD